MAQVANLHCQAQLQFRPNIPTNLICAIKTPESVLNTFMMRLSPINTEVIAKETSYTAVATKLTSGKSNQQEQDLLDELVKQEESNVRRAKILVFVAIVVCAVAVCIVVFILARESDHRTFELEYENFVKEITELVQWEVQYNFALMQQMSAALTSGAIMTGSVFPHVTLPHFEISGGYVDGMGGIMNLGYAPLIKESERDKWEIYSELNQGWLLESAHLKVAHPGHRNPLIHTIQDHESDRRLQAPSQARPNISKSIYRWENGKRIPESHANPDQLFAPMWQLSPADESAINVNLLSDERLTRLFHSMIHTNQTVLSEATEIFDLYDFAFDPIEKPQKKEPHGFIMEPVYSSFEADREVVGILVGLTSFKNLFTRLLPEEAYGIHCVVTDSCGNALTFELNRREAHFLGYDDLHETLHDKYKRSTTIEFYDNFVEGLCVHELHITPSEAFVAYHRTNNGKVYTSVVAAFIATGIFLIIYDAMVSRRQKKTMGNFVRTNNLVASVFPEHVRDRLLNGDQGNTMQQKKDFSAANSLGMDLSRPLADFYPNTTILFADIAGFTAWCSTREPFEVFTLLEALYSSFDQIAKRRQVFKVETVGDCYVAVCGLPEPKKDHAATMVRFACECLVKLKKITHKLEGFLGPDTGDLDMRFGLNSGSVTAGVLRGENARFQLFGDTMNTASRMESTGTKGKIHVSGGTAKLLEAAGKGDWLVPRENKIFVKGKGEMQTFWISSPDVYASLKHQTSSVTNDDEDSTMTCEDIQGTSSDKLSRMVGWTSDVLLGVLMQIVAQRNATKVNEKKADELNLIDPNKRTFDEVKEVIALPNYNAQSMAKQEDIQAVVLEPEVVQQMHHYVDSIASLYNDNSFHNFEHATHVAMSVKKLLSRIVSPSDIPLNQESDHSMGQLLHDHTFGITSDPLTQFACVFSAIIHDVDHTGVPNAQLIKEDAEIARYYNGKSVAEQNSVDLAWKLLMQDKYTELRQTIYANDNELKRFRQLVVNAVMATDIVDKELKTLRNARWAKAFSDCPPEDDHQQVNSRKGTIVIEHLLQASDVAHTMQHWHVYRKWNELLFMECYKAYKEGRADADPSEMWYKGEIAFFDFYIIPLAKKLKECGVFGVSCDEYLDYAVANRREWELRGGKIVAEMVEKTNSTY